MRKSDSVVKQKKASSHLSGLEIVLNQMVIIDRSRTMEELNRAIQGILEYIGEYTKAGRAYTFEFIEKQSIYRNTSEWCAEGVKPQMDNLQAVPFMEMPYWHRHFLRGEKVVIEDIEAAKDEMPLEYRLLKAQDIHTVIVFPMFHTDTLWGFIGLDDPILDESRSLINLLTVVGSHLGSAYDSCHKSNLLDEKQNALQASIDAFQREQQFLQVLCQDYTAVFYADLKKDYLEILKVDPESNVLRVSAAEEHMTLSYKEIIENYCRQFMTQEEARKLKRRLNAERLMRELKTRDRISFRFQSLPNGAGHEYFEAQITRMAIDEENFKVLIGFRFIDDIVSENLDKLQSAGRYIQRLVDDVTDISQIESGHFHIEPAFFNVMTFFRDFQDIMGQMTADRKLHMTCRAHDILHPQIDADAIRLKQIYVNLVSNAVKYTPEGGTVHFELYEETSDSPGCVRLVSIVQDNGIGMTEDYMKKMYERFSRSVDTRINKVRGSGLGLAIVKELVDRMDGRIEVQSAVGVGTTFRVVWRAPARSGGPACRARRAN